MPINAASIKLQLDISLEQSKLDKCIRKYKLAKLYISILKKCSRNKLIYQWYLILLFFQRQFVTKGTLSLLNVTSSDSVITGLDLNYKQNQWTWYERNQNKTIPTTTTEKKTMMKLFLSNINYREHRDILPE